MSEPVAKQRPMINLDEFERRLKRPAPSSQGGDDPLAELARLVGNEQDPYQRVFQERPQGRPQSQGQSQGMSQLRQQPELRATRSGPQPSDDNARFENERAPRNPAPPAAQKGL